MDSNTIMSIICSIYCYWHLRVATPIGDSLEIEVTEMAASKPA